MAWDGSMAATQYLFSPRMQLTPPPTLSHLPPCITSGSVTLMKWVDETTHNFSLLRTYLAQCRDAGLGSKQGFKPSSGQRVDIKQENQDFIFTPPTRIPIPPSKDRPSWHLFCL